MIDWTRKTTAAQRAAEAAHIKARADWRAFREAILDDIAEGVTITPARRAEAARLRALASRSPAAP